MMRTMRLPAALLLCGVFLAAHGKEIMLPMRDGVGLRTGYSLPCILRCTNISTVIDRSPYGEWDLELAVNAFLPFGMAAVKQDIRGTGESGGKFNISTMSDDRYVFGFESTLSDLGSFPPLLSI